MKLQEEVNEFLEDKTLEELADYLGYSEKELLDCRDKKREKRGGFNKGVLLKSVKDTK